MKCRTVFARCNVSVWREVSYFGGDTQITNGAVAWVSRLVAGMSLRSSGFEAKSFYVRFVVDKVALGQDSLRVLQLFLVSTIPPMLQTHSSITDVIQS